MSAVPGNRGPHLAPSSCDQGICPSIDRIETDDALPLRVDVAIVGGGIVGMCTALALAQAGISVLVCEKGRIAGEQSSRNWGWCRAGIRDPREIPLANESVRMWSQLNAQIGAETGFRVCGSLFACETDAEVERWETWLKQARLHGMSSRMIDGTESADLLAGATRRFKGALYTPSDGRAEPQKATPAIAAAARRLGAVIVVDCAVRGLDMAAGRVRGIVTEKGMVAADTVVLAAGVWSRLFTMPLGLRLPLLKIEGSVLRTEPVVGGPDVMGWIGGMGFRRRLDGGYTLATGYSNLVSIVPDSFRFFFDFLPALTADWKALRVRLNGRFKEELLHWRPTSLDKPSAFERIRVLNPAPSQAVVHQVLQAAAQLLPCFAHARVAQQWAGMIDVTPDAIPIMSAVAEVPGLYLATGFSGHGFGVGPAAGKFVADLVMGRTPSVDPAPFLFSRFANSVKAKPGGLV